MKKQKDKEIAEIGLVIFVFFVVILSYALVFLIASIFPKLPWKEIGRLTLYGIGFLFATIYVIFAGFSKFQKRMIGLQVLTGVILFILYFTVIAILKVHHILKLPPNTWAYTGIFFIFVPLILYPALRLEYEFIIKRYLKNKNRTKRKEFKGTEEKEGNNEGTENTSEQTQ